MIAFIGYMGAGKTTIARRLANYLNLPFFDLDEIIEKSHGKSIAEIFASLGETAFRSLEKKNLIALLNTAPFESIIALGGGTPIYDQNLELIKNHALVVYLDASTWQIYNHLKKEKAEKRPLFNQNQLYKLENLQAHLAERRRYYEAAHIKLPLIVAKSPELLTMTLILFTKAHPDLKYLHNFL